MQGNFFFFFFNLPVFRVRQSLLSDVGGDRSLGQTHLCVEFGPGKQAASSPHKPNLQLPGSHSKNKIKQNKVTKNY